MVHDGCDDTPQCHAVQMLSQKECMSAGYGKKRKIVGEHNVADVDRDGVAA